MSAGALSLLLLYGTQQELRAYPTATISAGSWIAVNAPSLFGALDETGADDDADNIQSAGGSSDTVELDFGTLSTPAEGVSLVIRLKRGVDA